MIAKLQKNEDANRRTGRSGLHPQQFLVMQLTIKPAHCGQTLSTFHTRHNMEYLRNLPSKTNAFSSASYERVRGSTRSQGRPYFTTMDQTPNQTLPSSDENLILAAIRQKKQIAELNAEQPKKTPEPESRSDHGDAQHRPFKRPRIALSNTTATTRTRAMTSGTARPSSSSSSSSSSITSSSAARQ